MYNCIPSFQRIQEVPVTSTERGESVKNGEQHCIHSWSWCAQSWSSILDFLHVHLVIDILSSALLGSSNYCIQCLSALT
jgi:hypothetical protein